MPATRGDGSIVSAITFQPAITWKQINDCTLKSVKSQHIGFKITIANAHYNVSYLIRNHSTKYVEDDHSFTSLDLAKARCELLDTYQAVEFQRMLNDRLRATLKEYDILTGGD